MTRAVLEHPDFIEERETLPDELCDKLNAVILLPEQNGPRLRRPHVDTLAGSAHANMKEIRVKEQGVWRFAFAFDNREKRCCPGWRQQARQEPEAVLQEPHGNR